MPYHIKKTSILGSAVPDGGVEYYTGDNAWSNEYSKRKVYANQADADATKKYNHNNRSRNYLSTAMVEECYSCK